MPLTFRKETHYTYAQDLPGEVVLDVTLFSNVFGQLIVLWEVKAALEMSKCLGLEGVHGVLDRQRVQENLALTIECQAINGPESDCAVYG